MMRTKQAEETHPDMKTQHIIWRVIQILFVELGGMGSVSARGAIAHYYGCDSCGNFPPDGNRDKS